MAGPFSGAWRRSGARSLLARCYPILGARVWRVACGQVDDADAACRAAVWRVSRLRHEQLAAGTGDGVADVLAPQLAEGVKRGAQSPRVFGW